MCISRKGNSKVRLLTDDQQVEQVSQFKYLGSWISDDGYATKYIRARIAIGKTLFMDKKNCWRGIWLWAKEANYKEHSLECSIVCSGDLDIS